MTAIRGIERDKLERKRPQRQTRKYLQQRNRTLSVYTKAK